MPASITTLLLLCAAALAMTAAATWLLSRWWYGRRIGEMRMRHRQADQAMREKQSALVSQIDALHREARDQKALLLSLSAKSPAPRAPTPQEKVESMLSEPFITSRGPRKPLDFEDTQIL